MTGPTLNTTAKASIIKSRLFELILIVEHDQHKQTHRRNHMPKIMPWETQNAAGQYMLSRRTFHHCKLLVDHNAKEPRRLRAQL